jgi:hypothetical protein
LAKEGESMRARSLSLSLSLIFKLFKAEQHIYVDKATIFFTKNA